MPRTREEIIAHADGLAAEFEQYEPRPEDEVTTPEMRLRLAAWRRGEVEREVAAAVDEGRSAGMSWSAIGDLLGVSAQATQKRYGSRAMTIYARVGERIRATVVRPDGTAEHAPSERRRA